VHRGDGHATQHRFDASQQFVEIEGGTDQTDFLRAVDSVSMQELTPVFKQLRGLLDPYVTTLAVSADSETELSLNTRHRTGNGKPLFFAAVKLTKTYVAFHLMPVYVRPALLSGLSPQLRRRMQGKSCFNFTRIDEALLAELESLTRAAFESYREQGYV
jgi:hypothetical protein